jgi:hypothetical protein
MDQHGGAARSWRTWRETGPPGVILGRPVQPVILFPPAGDPFHHCITDTGLEGSSSSLLATRCGVDATICATSSEGLNCLLRYGCHVQTFWKLMRL